MNLNFAWRSSFKVVQSCLTTNGYKVLDHSCHCGWRDYSRLLWRFKSHKGELYCPITFSMSIKDGSESTGAIDCPVHSVSTHVVDDPHPESWSAADVWSASDAHLRLAVLCARHLRAADAAGGRQLWTGKGTQTLDASAPPVPRQTFAHRRQRARHHHPGHGHLSRSFKIAQGRTFCHVIMRAPHIVILFAETFWDDGCPSQSFSLLKVIQGHKRAS